MSYSVSEEYEELKSIVGTWNDDNTISVKNDRPRIDIEKSSRCHFEYILCYKRQIITKVI